LSGVKSFNSTVQISWNKDGIPTYNIFCHFFATLNRCFSSLNPSMHKEVLVPETSTKSEERKARTWILHAWRSWISKTFFTFSLDEKKAMEFLDRHLLHLVNHKYRKAIFLPYFVVVVVVAKIVVSQQFLSATLSQIISPRFLSSSILWLNLQQFLFKMFNKFGLAFLIKYLIHSNC